MDEELFDQETDLEDAINAFMKSEPDDDDLSDDDEDEPTTEADEEEAEAEEEDEDAEEGEEESEDDPDDSEDDDEDEGKPAAKTAEDDAEVAITVDGKEHRVSVKDLKRLYGQEASLTQKSQALAAQRRIVEAQGMFAAQVLQDRYTKAKAEAEKYKDVDLFRASRELDPDEFDALRSAKENAESELAALEREGREFLTKTQQVRSQMLREQAQQAIKEITKAIPDWNDDLYTKIRTYAVSQGMEAELVNEIVDPAAILMMHKAMKFDEVQSAKGKVTKKVSKAPKKAVSKGDKATDNTTSKLKAKHRTAAESGDIDDVAEAFLAAMRDQ
jgi:ribosomal protein L25 (general stress protein Ctc)